jgi:hypothetical protein
LLLILVGVSPVEASSPNISSFTPTLGITGTSVVIIGTNLTGATAVKIGGTAASSFTVNSASQITAVVGSGSTGTISVTTPGGTATSTGSFTYYAAPADLPKDGTINQYAALTGVTGCDTTTETNTLYSQIVNVCRRYNSI